MKLFCFKKNKITSHTEKEITDLLDSIGDSVEKLDRIREEDEAERVMLKKASSALYKRCASLLKLVEDYEEQRNG